ncbi:MAG: DNA topoisomerase I [Nanoarchaeota archaeon]|nr:DNA topoisomerase I [Nanoarchaeota archaeon]
MVELIITEKPQAAKKIADALADGKPLIEKNDGVAYYSIVRKGKDILVGCAVGHLFGLEQKETAKKWTYPVFEVEWKPSYDKKESAHTKKYLMTLKKLAKQASEITVATDYDVEGEVIGLNVVRYACNRKDASRMKFSTLMKEDLVEAYEHKSKTLDWGQANAGETRHKLDWYNGINYSRALTGAVKANGAFKIMSIGRVQGPALKIIVDREKEISAFKPKPYWEIELDALANKENVVAWHKEEKFWEKPKAEAVMKKIEGAKEGIVQNTSTSETKQAPPTPFDLTTLQTEMYRCHKIAPKRTLEIAQELYVGGYISYPRTSSQQYPESIGYRKLLSLLGNNPAYADLVKKLLSQGSLQPNNGKKTDPAHPAIYPTGASPSLDTPQHEKLYDIIARRFLATFAPYALRETTKFDIIVREEPFVASGTRTKEKGWHLYYGPYVNLEEQEMPKVQNGEKVTVKKSEMHEKETKPPARYNASSILRELEKKNLGTKSTRASIVDTLFERGYLHGKSIEATELGMRLIDTLQRHAPKIIDEELTRHFEDEMEEIREGKKTGEEVLEEAQAALTRVLTEVKSKEKDIGKELLAAHRETQDAMSTVGACPLCKEGKLQIRKGKFGLFIACNRYPECKSTFSLPSNTLVRPTEKTCEHCQHPIIQVISRGKKPQEICLNKECPSKEAKDIKEKPCPTCKEGTVVVRKSVYGPFLGCNRYPACKYTEQIKR